VCGHLTHRTLPDIDHQRGPVVLTDGALLAFDGHDESRPIYLALNGTIYDVSANPRIYGPGGMYNVFAGRDAARGFVTGCFAEDNVPDLRGVEWMFVPVDVPTYEEKSDAQLESSLMREYRAEKVTRGKAEVEGTLKHWAKVFRGETGKDYFEIGYVDRKSGYWAQKPARKLCANAEKKRPKAQFEDWIQQRRIGRAQKEKEERDGKKKDEL
jgi:predicted heme/steroid binding protein